MDAKLIYWAVSLLWMSCLWGTAWRGRRAIQRGDLERHRRLMNLAAIFVGVFLLSYVAKVLFLGKEDLAQWSFNDRLVLYIHETFVLIMVVAGGLARYWARVLPKAGGVVRSRHQWAGRIAIAGGLFGLFTALFVFLGMVQRAGLLP